MSNNPKGIKGIRRKLRDQKEATAAEVRKAMLEASKAIDRLTAQNQFLIEKSEALEKIITGERAQIIYYQEKYVASLQKTCTEIAPFGWLDLTDEQRLEFTRKAVKELYGKELKPHLESQPEKGIILQ